jgi:hypothetical protein
MSRPLRPADVASSSAAVRMCELLKSCLGRATILTVAVEKWAPDQVNSLRGC